MPPTFDSARRCAVQQFHVFYRSLTDTTSEQLQRRSRNRVIGELAADPGLWKKRRISESGPKWSAIVQQPHISGQFLLIFRAN